jgi:hypothetical protein
VKIEIRQDYRNLFDHGGDLALSAHIVSDSMLSSAAHPLS